MNGQEPQEIGVETPPPAGLGLLRLHPSRTVLHLGRQGLDLLVDRLGESLARHLRAHRRDGGGGLRGQRPGDEGRVNAVPWPQRVAQTSSPTARISASALLFVTTPGRIV